MPTMTPQTSMLYRMQPSIHPLHYHPSYSNRRKDPILQELQGEFLSGHEEVSLDTLISTRPSQPQSSRFRPPPNPDIPSYCSYLAFDDPVLPIPRNVFKPTPALIPTPLPIQLIPPAKTTNQPDKSLTGIQEDPSPQIKPHSKTTQSFIHENKILGKSPLKFAPSSHHGTTQQSQGKIPQLLT